MELNVGYMWFSYAICSQRAWLEGEVCSNSLKSNSRIKTLKRELLHLEVLEHGQLMVALVIWVVLRFLCLGPGAVQCDCAVCQRFEFCVFKLLSFV